MNYVLYRNDNGYEYFYVGNAPFTILGEKIPHWDKDIKQAVIYENKKDASKAAKKLGNCVPKKIEIKKECYKIKNFNLKTAIKRYNSIMFDLGYEYMTIGTEFSEDTDNFGIFDMVDECQYWLDTFYESGHVNGDLRYSDDPDERKIWRSKKCKLERFINTYSKFI